MHDSFVHKEISRTNRNLLIANLLLFMGITIFCAMKLQYLYSFLIGPVPADLAHLISADPTNLISGQWISVHGDANFHTGIVELNVRTDNASKKIVSQQVTFDYVLISIAEHYLLVKANHIDSAITTYSGFLRPIPDEIRERAIAPFLAGDPSLSSAIFPIMLDTSNFRVMGWWGLALLGPLFLLSIWNLKLYLNRTADITRHPIHCDLARMGGLQTVDGEILFDIRATNWDSRTRQVVITSRWIIVRKWFVTKFCRIANITYAYKRVTKHRTNFIPTGKSYALIIVSPGTKDLEVTVRQKTVDRCLSRIAEIAPSVVGVPDNAA